MRFSDFGFTFDQQQLNICYEIHRVWISAMKQSYHPSIPQSDILQFLINLEWMIKHMRELPTEEISKLLEKLSKFDTYFHDVVYYSWVLPTDDSFSAMDKLAVNINFCRQELSSPHYFPIHLADYVLPELPEAEFILNFSNSHYEKFIYLAPNNTDEEFEKINNTEEFIPCYKITINMVYYLEKNHDKNGYLLKVLEPFIFDYDTVKTTMRDGKNITYIEQMKKILSDAKYLKLYEKTIPDTIKTLLN